MRIIFFGTSEFAAPALKALVRAGHTVMSVVTQPQRQRGRGLKVVPQAIEEAAKESRLKVLTFDDVNSEEAVRALKAQGSELFVVAAFGQILSSKLLEVPTLYALNIHASLLPKYRGAAPIQWAIINGEKKTGLSIIRMNENLDQGDILLQQELEISDDEDADSLSRRLSSLGADLLIQTLKKISAGNVQFLPQDEPAASYAPKLTKKDGLIDWKKDSVSIKNLVRGCYPWPSAYTYMDKKHLKILQAEVSVGVKGRTPGSVIKSGKDGILVACGDGAILITKLQLEGKRPLTTEEFLRGHPLPEGTTLG